MKNFFQKLRGWADKLSFLSLPLCFASFVFLDYAFRLFYRFVGTTRLLALRPMAFTLCWSLLLTCLVSLLPRLGRRIAMLVLILLFALLTVTHGVMYNVFGHFFSFADMNFAGDGARFFSWSYFNLRKAFVLCVVLAVLLMVLAAFLAGKPRPGGKRWKTRVAVLVLAVLAAVPIGLLHAQLLPEEEGISWDTTYDPSSDESAYKAFSDPNRCLNLAGLYQYTFRDLTVSLGLGENRQSAEKLTEYYESRADEISGENEMTGLMKGKNLIMIMLESADTWLATPEYMPNLWKIREQSVDFTRFYTPLFLSAGTFNTEIISQTGLIPTATGLPASAFSTNSFPLSLAHLFAKEGYTVNSFHSASPAIYSRGSVHVNLGFEAYHNYVDMNMDNYQLDSQMMNGYDLMVSDEKFFTFIITYSGHGPYTEEMGVIAAPHYDAAKKAVAASGVSSTPENMEEYTRAVAHAMEADAFIGQLLDRLEQDGLLENTALLFYADHYGKYMSDRDFLAQVKGAARGTPDQFRTPCFLYLPGVEAKKEEKLCSSVDLAPTVVNLFDLDAPRNYYPGDDIFGDKEGFVIFPNYEWLDEDGYWDLEAQTGASEDVAARAADIRERVRNSIDVLKTDYFKFREE